MNPMDSTTSIIPAFSNFGPVQDPNMVGQEQQTQQPAAQNPAAPAHQKGNFFTNNLSTGLGIGGGILGAVFGGGVGGIGGAAGGSALGKYLENVLEGNGAGDDVLKAGIEGGVGQVAGGVVGKVIGKGAKLAKGAADNIVEKTAAKEAIAGRANALKDVAPKLQSQYKANDSLDHVKNMGFDPTDVSQVQHVANSTNDILNDTLNRTLTAAGPVDLSNYSQIIKDALAAQSGTLGSFNKVAVSRGRFAQANTPAGKLLSQLEDLGAGVAKSGSDPNEIRTLTTKLGKLAADAKPVRSATTGAIDPEQEAAYQAIKAVRDQVKTSLYHRPEVSDAIRKEVGNITAEDVGSQQLADHLNNIISQAGKGTKPGAEDLLGEMSRNIDISKLGREMGDVKQIASSTGGQARAASDAGISLGPEGNGVNQAMDVVGAAGAALKHPIAGVGSLVSHTVQNPAVLETLSRIGKLGEKVAPSAGVAASIGNGQLNSGANSTMGDMNMQAQAPVASPEGPADGLTQNDLITLALYSPQAFSSLVTPSAVNQEKVAAADSASNSLMGLQGQSPDGGILSSLAGRFGIGEAGAYQRKAQAAAQQVAAATGTDAGKVEAMLTNYMAGGGNIDEAIQQLLGNLQSVKQNNTNSAYQGLMNYGGSPAPTSIMSQIPQMAT